MIVLCVLLITVSVRVGNAGVFAAVRTGVHSISSPLQQVCSVVSKPFRAIGGSSSAISEDEAEQLRTENEQLRTLVAQLEEYRQQDQRLTTLLTLADTYGLESVSARVVSTTDGWSRTATIDVGTSDGVKVGMGVMSSCGLYGQVESVTANNAVVRLINDANSNVSAMIQSTRESGILTGSYDGNLTLDYISVDSNVGEGDVILTSGEGGVYPRGMIIGTVKTIDPDASRLYYRITVQPIFNIKSCEEVLVLTGNESETASLLNLDLLDRLTSSLDFTSSEWWRALYGTEEDEAAREEDAAASGEPPAEGEGE